MREITLFSTLAWGTKERKGLVSFFKVGNSWRSAVPGLPS
jgi:hypothetical protein